VIYERVRDLLPPAVRRYVLHFEAEVDRSVADFARSLPKGARVLDAGAGEAQYKHHFPAQRYCGIDLGVGDAQWDYSLLDVVGDLAALPFPDATFDACLNLVTLEHVRDPIKVIREMARALSPGGRLLLVAPLEWEEHQEPHDYLRFTKYALRFAMERAGLEVVAIEPVGGFFRLLSRRLFNALQFFPTLALPFAALVFVPLGLVAPLLDPLDTRRNFTLGYICVARKPSAG
jgi:SAM-dependent methyltransferase